MSFNTVDIQTIVQSILSGFSYYKEAVVLDYISNPSLVTEDQVSTYGSNFSLSMIQRCPRGTIVGHPIGQTDTVTLFYPFFSNHVSLPVKPGEYVWYFQYGRIYYWISRRVADYGYEDVNYTKASNANKAKKISSAEPRPKDAFAGSGADLSSDQAQSLGNEGDLTLSMLPGNLTFDRIKKNSNAGKQIVYEPVPVYSSKCGEFSLQGSNNTSIVQGSNFGGGKKSESGYVDISAGRGRISDTGVTVLDDQDPPVASREVLNPNEGEPSIATDASRIVVSHGMDPDGLFQTGLPSGTVNQAFSPSIVSKSDKIRVIARSDVAVSVEGSNGCSVVLNSNGDIYVNPAASGKVYLSGPGSDQPYLRYDDFRKVVDGIEGILGALQTAISLITTTTPGSGALATVSTDIGTDLANIESAMISIKSQKIVGS